MPTRKTRDTISKKKNWKLCLMRLRRKRLRLRKKRLLSLRKNTT